LPLGQRIAQWLQWLGRPGCANALSIHDERLPVAHSRHTANICLQFTHCNASGIDHRAANSEQQTANGKQQWSSGVNQSVMMHSYPLTLHRLSPAGNT